MGFIRELYTLRKKSTIQCYILANLVCTGAFTTTAHVCTCRFDYLHKKQSGGAGQYGRVIGELQVYTCMYIVYV